MGPRLASSVLVAALMRRAESEGGFAAILSKGDPTAGSVLVVLTERGGNPRLMERVLQPGGDYAWQNSLGGAANEEGLEKFLERRRKFDPDIWIVELDIASAERFADAMNDFD